MLPPPVPAGSAEPAQWIQQHYDWDRDWITAEVGVGFDSYVRVFHPGVDADEVTTWADVAAAHGKVMHPAAHWEEITAVGPWDPKRLYDSNTNSGVYLQGELPQALLETLCQVLRRHTTTPEDCFFAVWNGWGWESGSSSMFFYSNGESTPAIPQPDPAFAMDRAAPRFSVPARDFMLYQGQIEQAACIGGGGYYPGFGFLRKQSPTLMWPADHAWCVSTEIDCEYTIIGCSSAAGNELLTTAGVEAALVSPDTPAISDLNQ